MTDSARREAKDILQTLIEAAQRCQSLSDEGELVRTRLHWKMEQERRHLGRHSREPPKQETTWNSYKFAAASSAFDGRGAVAGTTVAGGGGTGAGTDAGGGTGTPAAKAASRARTALWTSCSISKIEELCSSKAWRRASTAVTTLCLNKASKAEPGGVGPECPEPNIQEFQEQDWETNVAKHYLKQEAEDISSCSNDNSTSNQFNSTAEEQLWLWKWKAVNTYTIQHWNRWQGVRSRTFGLFFVLFLIVGVPCLHRLFFSAVPFFCFIAIGSFFPFGCFVRHLKTNIVNTWNGGIFLFSSAGQKWVTLKHNGVLFAPEHKPHGVKMKYEGMQQAKDIFLFLFSVNFLCFHLAFHVSMRSRHSLLIFSLLLFSLAHREKVLFASFFLSCFCSILFSLLSFTQSFERRHRSFASLCIFVLFCLFLCFDWLVASLCIIRQISCFDTWTGGGCDLVRRAARDCLDQGFCLPIQLLHWLAEIIRTGVHPWLMLHWFGGGGGLFSLRLSCVLSQVLFSFPHSLSLLSRTNHCMTFHSCCVPQWGTVSGILTLSLLCLCIFWRHDCRFSSRWLLARVSFYYFLFRFFSLFSFCSTLLLSQNHVIQDVSKCNFQPIYDWIVKQREDLKKKKKTSKFKEQLKEEKAQLDEKYGFALVDGFRQKVQSYRVEAPGLFFGRGKHPKRGCFKVSWIDCWSTCPETRNSERRAGRIRERAIRRPKYHYSVFAER